MDNSETFYIYNSPVGPLALAASTIGLTALRFGGAPLDGCAMRPSAVTNTAATQVLEYLAGKRRYFDVPLDLRGTDFQLAVWRAISAIPFASCATCSDLADIAGYPGSNRLVGQAVKANPLPLLIPDHRIVTANGQPYGSGPEAKRRASFLAFEQRQGV